MQSDIEICRNTPLSSIATVAANAGLLPHEFDTHGKHKAKVHPQCLPCSLILKFAETHRCLLSLLSQQMQVFAARI